MAEVITRFRLETTQYDSKLRDAAKGLADYTKQATMAGNEFGKFTQKNVEAARALGNIAPSATNAKDKVKELVTAFNDIARTYNALTKEQQQSDFGKAMAQSLEQLKGKIREAKQELYSMGDAAQQTQSKMQGVLGAVVGGRGGMVGNIAAQLGATKTQLIGISAAVAGVGAAFKLVSDNIGTAMNFEKSMSGLSALTGMVGDDLERLKEYAIELGGTTTLTASQVADAFRLIGSQQPQLLESGEALKEVTKYAIQLSEAAGIDLMTASQTLSTSINQMGGDSNNAARYVNVLAAASQKGAGDIAWLGEAITKAATAAKAVGTDYEELVANLEQLAKAGFDASTAGTALRSIIMNLEKQANDEFKPSIVGLTQAFENLGRANLSIVEYQQIAGKMFASQAMALANAAGEAKNMTAAITDTNVATEQATTNTANLDGSLKSLSSAWEALNLHINSGNGLLKDAVDWFKEVVQWADQSFTAAGRAQKRLAELKGEQNTSGGTSTGNTKVDRQIGTLSHASQDRRQGIYNQEVQNYWRYINAWQNKLKEAEGRKDLWAWETIKKEKDIAEARDKIDGAKELLKEYQQRAKSYITQPATTDTKGGKAVVDLSVDVDGDGSGMKTIKQLQDELKKLKKLRDEAANAGKTAMRDQYNAQIKDVNAQIKALRGGGGSTTTGTTPQQQATKRAADAQHAYDQAMELAAIQLKNGTITEADAKKKELQAREQLWKALGDAYNIHKDPKYKEAQDECSAKIKQLGGEVKASVELEKRAQEDARNLERAQKRLIDAKNRQAAAEASGSYKEVVTAKKQVTTATNDLKRIEVSADVAQAMQNMRLINAAVLQPKTFAITADDQQALDDIRAIEGATLDDKTMTVTVDSTEATDQLKAIDNIKLEPKTFRISPEVEDWTIPQPSGDNTLQERARETARNLERAQKRVIDARNRQAAAEQMGNKREVTTTRRQVTTVENELKNIEVSADVAQAMQNMRLINAAVLQPKTFSITADDQQALDDIRAIDGATLDEKTMTVTVDSTEATDQLKAIDSIKLEPKTFRISAEVEDWSTTEQMGNNQPTQRGGTKKSMNYTSDNLEGFISELKDNLSKADLGSEIHTKLTAQLVDANALGNLMQTAIKNGIDVAQFDPQELWRKVFGDNPGDYISDETWQGIVDKINEQMSNAGQQITLDTKTGDVKDKKPEKTEKGIGEKMSTLASGLSSVTSGLQNLGFEIPEGVQEFIGAIQGISSIIQGIQTVISIFQTSSMTANTAAIIANTAALTANSFTRMIPFMANGGVAHAADGWSGTVPGTHFSGDMVPIMVNSGELILNRAQQGVIASALGDGGNKKLQIELIAKGEELRGVINANGRRTGRGEIVTTNFR